MAKKILFDRLEWNTAPDATEDLDEDKDPLQEDEENSTDKLGNQEGEKLGNNEGEKPDDDEQKDDDPNSEGEDNGNAEEDSTEGESEGVDDEKPVIDLIIENIGIDVGDKKYEDTVDGVQELIQDLAEVNVQATLKTVFTQFPVIDELMTYLSNGGDVNKFMENRFPSDDFSSIEEVRKEDKALQRRLLALQLQEQGFDADTVEETVEEHETAGILHSSATKALSFLQKKQKAEFKALKEQQQAAAEAELAEIEKAWNEARNTLDTQDNFSGIIIPKKDKAPFYEWLRATDKKGISAREKAWEELNTEQMIALDYLIFKGLDLSTLVETKANSKSATTLRARLKGPDSDRKGVKQRRKSKALDLDRLRQMQN